LVPFLLFSLKVVRRVEGDRNRRGGGGKCFSGKEGERVRTQEKTILGNRNPKKKKRKARKKRKILKSKKLEGKEVPVFGVDSFSFQRGRTS